MGFGGLGAEDGVLGGERGERREGIFWRGCGGGQGRGKHRSDRGRRGSKAATAAEGNSIR